MAMRLQTASDGSPASTSEHPPSEDSCTIKPLNDLGAEYSSPEKVKLSIIVGL